MERDEPSPFDDSPDGFCVTGPGGRILHMNPAAERLLGLPLERAAGVSLCELLCARIEDGCAARCPLRAVPAGEPSAAFEGYWAPKAAFAWRDGEIARTARGRVLRVRCLPAEGERRVTFIEAAADSSPGE